MYTTYRYHCCCFKSLSHVQLFVTQWTVDCQTPLSMGLPRQEYWRGLPFSSPGDLPNPGIECASPALAGGFFTTEPSGKLTYRYISLVVLRFCTHTHTHTHTYTATLSENSDQTKLFTIHFFKHNCPCYCFTDTQKLFCSVRTDI